MGQVSSTIFEVKDREGVLRRYHIDHLRKNTSVNIPYSVIASDKGQLQDVREGSSRESSK